MVIIMAIKAVMAILAIERVTLVKSPFYPIVLHFKQSQASVLASHYGILLPAWGVLIFKRSE